MTDARTMPRQMRRSAAKRLAEANSAYPEALTLLPRSEWPKSALSSANAPSEIWRSRRFLLQVYPAGVNVERLSVNRCEIDSRGNWSEQITWDDLQALKAECGRGEFDAVEIFPADDDVVNVANMRHLWVLKRHDLNFIWREKTTSPKP